MKSRIIACLVLLAAALFQLLPPRAMAEEKAAAEAPWEKFGVNLGLFASATSSGFRIGSGVGVSVDVEEALGLDSSTLAFRADALWRFTQNRRHRLDFTWFSIHRDGHKQIGQDITIEDSNGEEVTIPAGTTVEGHFDLDIYELAYSYSFFQDERVDLAASLGLYVMPMDFGLSATGLVNESGSQDFTAPLPVVGLRMDFALTPQWFIRSGTQVFYAEYESFKGGVLNFHAAVEYNPWSHVGLGLGFDTLNIHLEADGEDYPAVDLRGEVDFNYTGVQLYARVFF
ncbi:MAG: hypothetical protein HY911_15995 [Desulfobacterales bacterium]|nr:hypothetical protein [Desulfobacterales bacterium]